MPATSPQAKLRKSRAQDARRKARNTERRNALPFVGCDGEGAKDDAGRSTYVLLRIGDRELHRDGARLTTPELLQFILDYPDASAILVGFFFDYDVSNILRDVSGTRDRDNPNIPSRLERILQVDLRGVAGDPNPYRFGGWTALRFDGYPQFGVQYIPHNYLKVCRLDNVFDAKAKRWTLQAEPGSTRTIYDTQGFFQCSFLDALKLWGVGGEHWDTIKAMKDDRASFAGLTDKVRRYNAIECDLLAELMTAFRAQCIATDMVPATWNGAGKIASALLKRHKVLKAARLEAMTPATVLKMAHAAYYGGRFETTRAGQLPTTWQHDINSAYPAAMLDVPCLEHGKWRKASGRELARHKGLFVARVDFTHGKEQFLCGLPFRSTQGRLCWPRQGNGVYWSPEIASAKRLGAKIVYHGGWRFVAGCTCKPFDFVRDLYEQRLKVGKSVRGIPIKLGNNSIYGKLAQRIGKPTYANPIHAGLITAITRAKINDAIIAAGNPRRVVMIATDAIYSVGGPVKKLPQGNGLGQWEVKRFASLFIVRPGLYWPPKLTKIKTRGLSPKFFAPLIPTFEAEWRGYLAQDWRLVPPPKVKVPVETFVGVRLAMRLFDPAQACQWIKRKIDCTFSWADKRKGATRHGAMLILGALPGHSLARSFEYAGTAPLPSSAPMELDRMLFEAQPDYVDLGPPGA
jgi:hypothetical protein